MSFATSALFPLSRTTTGISMPTSCIAETIPSATTSHLTIPPKILIKIDLTFESETIILKASVTLSLFTAPPTSRKFAGNPPYNLIISHWSHR